MIWDFVEHKPKTCVQCLPLAQHIYSSLDLHKEAIKCMVIQGKMKQALQYAQRRAEFSVHDYAMVLEEHANEDLCQELLSSNAMPVLLLAKVLLNCGHEQLAVHVMGTICEADPISKSNSCIKINQSIKC